jgi:hypothetical protein
MPRGRLPLSSDVSIGTTEDEAGGGGAGCTEEGADGGEVVVGCFSADVDTGDSDFAEVGLSFTSADEGSTLDVVTEGGGGGEGDGVDDAATGVASVDEDEICGAGEGSLVTLGTAEVVEATTLGVLATVEKAVVKYGSPFSST